MEELMFATTEKEKISELKYGGYNKLIFDIVPKNSKVLDIGCSTGLLAKLLKENKNCSVVGIDFDKKSLQQAEKYCSTVYEIDLDESDRIKNALNDERFDIITMGDVLEHLKHPGVLLKELQRYLKPNGMILAVLPNSAFISMRVKFLLGDYSYEKNGGLMDVDHLRFFSFRTAEILFREAGYRIESLSGNSVVKNKYWFLRPLSAIYPRLFSIHILIVAKNEI
ncbi:MAG: class I SAM-dependent methyltransferase [Candidatus Roizmanbacteria bacterium]|nr:class I SAM-dependent methyltransferase [Candidatus Roizmanbacteria bacterium]